MQPNGGSNCTLHELRVYKLDVYVLVSLVLRYLPGAGAQSEFGLLGGVSETREADLGVGWVLLLCFDQGPG